MSHPEKLLFTFTSMFGNDYYGEGHDYLFGTNATLVHTQSDQVRVVPQGAKTAAGPGPEDGGFKEFTDRRMRELLRLRPQPQRAGRPFELGFRTAISGGLGPAHALVGGHSRRVLPPSAWRSFPLVLVLTATWLPRLFAGADCTDKQPAAPHPLD